MDSYHLGVFFALGRFEPVEHQVGGKGYPSLRFVAKFRDRSVLEEMKEIIGAGCISPYVTEKGTDSFMLQAETGEAVNALQEELEGYGWNPRRSGKPRWPSPEPSDALSFAFGYIRCHSAIYRGRMRVHGPKEILEGIARAIGAGVIRANNTSYRLDLCVEDSSRIEEEMER